MRTFSAIFAATAVVLSVLSFTAATAQADDQTMNHAMMPGMTGMQGMDNSASSVTTWSGTGVVKSWSETEVAIAHRPIAALNWPAMTMRFALTGYQGAPVAAGQSIAFTFRQTDSGYALVSAIAQ